MTDQQPGPFAGIEDCVVHDDPEPGECGMCREETEAKAKVLTGQTVRLADLGQQMQDRGMRPPPDMDTNIRLQVLLGMLLSARGRTAFEAMVSQVTIGAYANAVREHDRMKVGGNGIILPTSNWQAYTKFPPHGPGG